MNLDRDDIIATATRMRQRYTLASYTARQRATDHAFSHDPGPEREFWLAVIKELDSLEVAS